MAQTATKIAYPTGQDPFQPHRDMKALAESAKVIVPVANRAEADDIASVVGATPSDPLFVFRGDINAIEFHHGSGWESTGVRRRVLRDMDVFASLATGATLTSAEAVIDEVPGSGFATVALRASTTGLNREAGTQNTELGILKPELSPPGVVTAPGVILNGAAMLSISSPSGHLRLRWSATAGSGALYVSANYSIEV